MNAATRSLVKQTAESIQWREHVESLMRDVLKPDRFVAPDDSWCKSAVRTLSVAIGRLPAAELKALAEHLHARMADQLDGLPLPEASQ